MKKIFIAYSRQDKRLLEKLKTHLSILERRNYASIWYDGEIEVGSNWEEEIHNALINSDIVLLLISSDFIASDYCYEKEMKKAVEMHNGGLTKVIPILLRPCAWELTPFSSIQGLPQNGVPISDWESIDKALLIVVNSIVEYINNNVTRIDNNNKSHLKKFPEERINELIQLNNELDESNESERYLSMITKAFKANQIHNLGYLKFRKTFNICLDARVKKPYLEALRRLDLDKANVNVLLEEAELFILVLDKEKKMFTKALINQTIKNDTADENKKKVIKQRLNSSQKNFDHVYNTLKKQLKLDMKYLKNI